MRRLKNIMLAMDANSSYRRIVEGAIVYRTLQEEPVEDSDSVYFYEDIGFRFSSSNQMENDKPTVVVQIPLSYLGTEDLSLAELSYCYRAFIPYLEELNAELVNRKKTEKETGKYIYPTMSEEILECNYVISRDCMQRDYDYLNGIVVSVRKNMLSELKTKCLCMMLQVQLPINNHKKAMKMLCHDLPSMVKSYLSSFDFEELLRWRETEKKQENIRAWLRENGYCTFIANGSILPRNSDDNGPKANAKPFVSPKDYEVNIDGMLGMGIKNGITIIAGGGYTGKTTLLEAISLGIYNHIPGDGREFCITSSDAMLISAEDGRSIKSCNISPFLNGIPNVDSESFSTLSASGSTSQAANLMEAVGYGAKLLLIDEDKSATNFLIKDREMRRILKNDPIIPFSDRVRNFYNQAEISTIAVIGGNSDMLHEADSIMFMENYELVVHPEYNQYFSGPKSNASDEKMQLVQNKKLLRRNLSIVPMNSFNEKIEVIQDTYLLIGDESIDVSHLKGICDKSQITAIGLLIRCLTNQEDSQYIDIRRSIEEVWEQMESKGIDTIFSTQFGKVSRFFALPRKQELMAVIDRFCYTEYEK